MSRCLGFGDQDGKCENEAGSRTSPLWCQSCEDERIAYLDRQFQKINERFAAQPPVRSVAWPFPPQGDERE